MALITNPILPGANVDVESVAAFNLLNAERARCGFGKLNWNDQLEIAARGHADWQLINNYIGHVQIVGTVGFTGVRFSDGYVAAGYAGPFEGQDETTSTLLSNNKKDKGVNGIRTLLSAPYHAFGLLGSFTDVGISVRNIADAGSTQFARTVFQLNPAYKTATGPQVSAQDVKLLTYPCAGTMDVEYALFNETPNPVPGRNLASNPIGTSIMITSPVLGATLVVTNASVTPSAGGAAVALLPTLTQATDGTGILGSHQAVLMPDLPLRASTTYTVSINATVNGEAVSTNYQFTTRR